MTHVMNYTAAASLNSNNNLMEYMIEVITIILPDFQTDTIMAV